MLKRLIDLLLYGNIWIALNAAAMVWLTHWVLSGRQEFTSMVGFVACGTWFVYALHRVVGLKRVQPFTDRGRYRIIAAFRQHIWAYAILGLLGAGYFYWWFPLSLKIFVLLPSLIALAYVLPTAGSGRRLRDFHFVKIFLIALAWSWLTVFSPAAQLFMADHIPVWIMGLERALFIFAITLPFDLRDLQVDAHLSVATIPSRLGVRPTLLLCLCLLLLAGATASLNYYWGVYNTGQWVGILTGYFLTLILCLASPRVKHDYYYSGLIDGAMLLVATGAWLGDWFFT